MVGTVERAFQLAPECSSIEELRSKLAQEGCSNVDAHLRDGLRRDLVKLLDRKRLKAREALHKTDD